MSLSLNNQLTLLHDLLDEQMIYQTGNINEYKQIKRIVKSIVASNQITNEQLLALLPEIYYYGIQGEHAQNMNELIVDYGDSIDHWKTIITETSLDL